MVPPVTATLTSPDASEACGSLDVVLGSQMSH